MTDTALSLTPPNASALGLAVARVLDDIWALYNLPGNCFKRIDWSDPYVIEVNFNLALSTYDFDHLTQLVVRCHDACLRLTICPCNMRYLKLLFHQRKGREGRMCERHPTMEDAILRVRSRSYFGPVPQQSEVIPEPKAAAPVMEAR